MNNLPIGSSVDETLRLVQAFQLNDNHGSVIIFYMHTLEFEYGLLQIILSSWN